MMPSVVSPDGVVVWRTTVSIDEASERN